MVPAHNTALSVPPMDNARPHPPATPNVTIRRAETMGAEDPAAAAHRTRLVAPKDYARSQQAVSLHVTPVLAQTTDAAISAPVKKGNNAAMARAKTPVCAFPNATTPS